MHHPGQALIAASGGRRAVASWRPTAFAKSENISPKYLIDRNYIPYRKINRGKNRRKFFLSPLRKLEEKMGILAGKASLVLSLNSKDGRQARTDVAVQSSQAIANGRSDGSRIGTLGQRASQLNDDLRDLPVGERLARFRREISGRIVLTTSFGIEGQVILHLIAEHDLDIEIATFDTGRLFPETYKLWAETEHHYGRTVQGIYPQHAHLEALVKKHGVNGFYDSREARLACCHARKVEPLNRALAGAEAWIVGLRADQSNQRESTKLVTVDERNLFKFSPLFDWSRDAVRAFALANNVPINPLHARGFASIGCAPCTRAIAPGEAERAGRWWWEKDAKKECGLHLTAERQLVGRTAPTTVTAPRQARSHANAATPGG
jgi:phosphoadenosine phosphosulfate reductase